MPGEEIFVPYTHGSSYILTADDIDDRRAHWYYVAKDRKITIGVPTPRMIRRPPPPLGGEREETTMPGPVFFNTSPACLRQPDERCRPACTNRLPAYTVRLVRLCSRHRLFTELALDTHSV